ncbi:hypothetical protein [Clostridium cellulovorans]|uniref:Uncharacterized protein n=1 Tax=Clostridium cellulovorans (strain ATCC 35296 / DSM 3052 / OCM 3 / 743B) TaxID=573061 RepID=D9SV77_CLOC7|nr:hypothetical protein [Clostridium cellulovorans]ADL53051.1 hypothetical protein Clocel_3372 [Clostridium cellulovorans 743B]
MEQKKSDENLTTEETPNKEKSNWRKKAISLNTAIIMTISGGSVLTGCSFKSYEEKVEEQEEEDQATYHGNGSSAFIFYSGIGRSSSSSYSKFSSSGWKSWTSSSSSSKGAIVKSGSSYSGSHATSSSS